MLRVVTNQPHPCQRKAAITDQALTDSLQDIGLGLSRSLTLMNVVQHMQGAFEALMQRIIASVGGRGAQDQQAQPMRRAIEMTQLTGDKARMQ